MTYILELLVTEFTPGIHSYSASMEIFPGQFEQALHKNIQTLGGTYTYNYNTSS